MGKAAIARIARIAGLVIPSACREEVLGDLQERSSTGVQFCIGAAGAIPCVIFSRIRRTADTQQLLVHAGVVYLCYWAAAWFQHRALIGTEGGLLQLGVPAAMVLLSLVFEGAYASAGAQSPWRLVRGPVIGLAVGLISEAVLGTLHSRLTLSLLVVMYGAVLSLALTSAVRLLFSPQSASPKGPQAL